MKKVTSLITVFLLIFNSLLGQDLPSCSVSTTAGTPRTHAGALFKPATNGPGEYFRALIVFAQFEDNHDVIDNWPEGSLPSWANGLIATSPSTTYPNSSISQYFKVMSNNRFDFIGDIYPNLITVPSTVNYSDANDVVFSKLNSIVTDFKRYDNWGATGSTFTFSERNGDGFLDMLIIIYRSGTGTFGLSGGIATLGSGVSYKTHDNIIINKNGPDYTASGITSSCTRNRNTDCFTMAIHLAHEYGHYLFGGNHTRVSGLMIGDPYAYYGGTGAMSAWERNYLGYSDYVKLPTTDGLPIALHDYVTTSEAIKIPIPFNNPTSDEYIILENHERKSPWDQVIRGGALGGAYNTNTQIGRGLYAWYVKGGDYYPPDTYALTADGSWDWEYAGEAADWPGEVLLRRAKVNNILGEGNSDRNPNLYYRWPDWHHRWHDINPLTNQWEITREVMGDETDAFNMAHNQLITPWSNPSTTRRNSSGLLESTSISIQLFNQFEDSTILKIYSTQAAALSLPPSKPQSLKNEYATGIVRLTWDANTEPDIASYNIYKAKTPGNIPSDNEYIKVGSQISSRNFWNDNEFNYGNEGWKAFYKITAVDSSNYESVKSDFYSIDYLKTIPSDFRSNTTLSGNYYTESNINVYPGAKLTLAPGTSILLLSGSSIIVNGSLVTQGTGNKPVNINFYFQNADLHNGISANPGSSIQLKNTFVKNAEVGIRAYDAGIYIDSCNFDRMFIGLDLEYTYRSFQYSNSYIKNSYISYCYESGIWIKNSIIRLENDTLNMCTQRGIRILNNSAPSLYRNTILNTGYAMTVMVGSAPRLFASTDCGHNTINSTSFAGVLMQYSATLLAAGGSNIFKGSSGHHIYAVTYSDAQAAHNYWGINIPNTDKFYTDATSNIDYSDWLESETGAGSSFFKAGIKSELQQAYDEIMNRNYESAEGIFKKIIKEKFNGVDSKIIIDKSNKNEARYALNGLAACYTVSGRDGFKKYLTEEIKPSIKDTKDDRYLQFLEHYNQCLYMDGEYDEVLANMKFIKDNFSLGNERIKILDFQEAFIQLAFKGNERNSQEILNKIVSENPDSATIVEAKLLWSSYKKGAFAAYKDNKLRDFMKKSNTEGNLGVPSEYNLYPNYPNPFNPTTTISYSLPVHSNVEIKIFDLMGNEIKSFNVNYQAAGYHSLQWNGRNANNEPVSSGIYILRLKAVSNEDGKMFEKSTKMMLVK